MESQELLEKMRHQTVKIKCRPVRVKVNSSTKDCHTKNGSKMIPKPVQNYDYKWVCSANDEFKASDPNRRNPRTPR